MSWASALLFAWATVGIDQSSPIGRFDRWWRRAGLYVGAAALGAVLSRALYLGTATLVALVGPPAVEIARQLWAVIAASILIFGALWRLIGLRTAALLALAIGSILAMTVAAGACS